MQAFVALWAIIKNNVGKAILIFVLGGLSTVLGIVPGTQNVSNVVGAQITSVKTSLGTAASPTIVQ